MIDLHSHTTASDGELSPEALVALAKEKGVRALAVTDHDTTASVARARAAGMAEGVQVIAGIELSCELNRREVHILGHFVDPDDARLVAYAVRFARERDARMEAMVAKVAAMGFPVSFDEVRARAPASLLGRPHLAALLVEKGYCTSVQEAFNRLLGDGKPAWVPRERLSCADAMALIHAAGGAATLAHPGLSRVHEGELQALSALGLDGLEVEHSEHPPSQRENLHALAAGLGLVPTAGSDYHGPRVAPHRQFGSVQMQPAHFEALARKAERGRAA